MFKPDQLRNLRYLLKSGSWHDIWTLGRTHWHSESRSIGLRRDMLTPFPPPPATIPFTVRELRPGDAAILFGEDGQSLSFEARRQRSVRIRMLNAQLETRYVAVNDAGEPCYVQWLIGSCDNESVRALFGDRFPLLSIDEMLLEGAFTREVWRGKGIMASAMAQIAEKSVAHQARWVITFVASDNIPSLRGCKKSGFEPYIHRTDRWRRFRHRCEFSEIEPPVDS